MTSPDRKPDIESSWTDEMPWSFYARQAVQAAQEAGEEPTEAATAIAQPSGGRENHIQERQREWS